ncbi:MAG: SDR family NAD(P)-dependent oxidoreductase [Candidatus Dojkabacteria bacterium]
MQNLKGKYALVTGASDGLGRLLAQNLAKQGSNVLVHGRNQKKLDDVLAEVNKIAPEGKHSIVVCDFNKPETIDKAFSGIDTLDVLVNNAGIWAEGETTGLSHEKILEVVNVNLTSYLLVTRTLLPTLQKSDFGQILNVSSVAGVEIPQDYFHTIYSATKYGVQAFSEALAKEFGNTNLRVMGYYPGGMTTDLFKKAGLGYKDEEPWMFDPQESVDAMVFMLTRDKKVNVKRLDLINHLEE